MDFEKKIIFFGEMRLFINAKPLHLHIQINIYCFLIKKSESYEQIRIN